MTGLHERQGRRYVPATIAGIVAAVMRSPTLRDAVAAALVAHPEWPCRECEGRETGGRVVMLAKGSWTWLACKECRDGARVAMTPPVDDVTPPDS